MPLVSISNSKNVHGVASYVFVSNQGKRQIFLEVVIMVNYACDVLGHGS